MPKERHSRSATASCFVAPVGEAASPESAQTAAEQDSAAFTRSEAAASEASGTAFPRDILPRPLTRLIGRAGDLDRVESLLGSSRLVAVVGAGGIGKTRLALAIAVTDRVRRRFPGGVWLADLGPLDDPGLVPTAIASALGIQIRDGEVLRGITLFLSTRRGLLIVDGCEHLIQAVAAAAEAILRACPEVAILAVSREPLRAEGESLHRLQPLGMAPATAEIGANQLDEYPASELFVERARAVLGDFAPTDAEAREVMEICRRLDGIPLAIELAAPTLEALTLAELRERLDSRFALLTAGRRTALPRQQTLKATISWSYDLLKEPERVLLRCVAIFAGPFSLAAAGAVAASRELASSEVIEGLLNLVAKSLVLATGVGAFARYRLLDTTRAYALEKLGESGELEVIARRHAEYFRDLFARAESEWGRHPPAEWLARHAREIDNVRAAIDWSFSGSGDPAIGIDLTAAFVPVWSNLSLTAELQQRAELALQRVDTDVDLRTRMELQIALGTSLTITLGSIGRTRSVLTSALEIAEDLDDLDAQVRILWALWALYFNIGECRTALEVAGRFSRIASRTSDPGFISVADRVMGYTLQYLGDHQQARRCFERVLQVYVRPQTQRDKMWFLYDQRVLARAMLARCLWLEGRVDRAESAAQESLAEAEAANDPLAICFALALALCPIALMRGDLVAAERWLNMLIEIATRQGFARYVMVGRCTEAALLVERREFEAGTALLLATLDARHGSGWMGRFTEYLGILARGMAGMGQTGKALATVDQALARAETAERWYLAELLRIKGELLFQDAAVQSIAKAEHCFIEATGVARRQGALFWELRAAMSHARLLARQGRRDQAREALLSVYNRFSEGSETADLRLVRATLGQFGSLPNLSG